MNRRRFFGAALPLFFGSAALRASAQGTPAPKAKPRRIRIEVSLLKPDLALDGTYAQRIVLDTEEGVETSAMFLRMYSFHESKAGGPLAYQEYGPKLAVTAHLEADGRIHLTGRLEFTETPAATATPNAPLAITSTALALARTVTNGQSVTLGDTVIAAEGQARACPCVS